METQEGEEIMLRGIRTLIIGMGEIGHSYRNVLSSIHPVYCYDIVGDWGEIPNDIEVMHIATPYVDGFENMVREYAIKHKPTIINVATTVPPGTCESIGDNVCHSTTRGLHPKLEIGIKNIVKHIGGPMSERLAAYFSMAGIPCYCHKRAATTELAHILNNVEYGVLLMFADEMARICRAFGCDYIDSVVKYKETYNHGFASIDHASKCRPILTPPNGKIGGHCVTQNAEMMYPLLENLGVSAPLLRMVAEYNKKESKR